MKRNILFSLILLLFCSFAYSQSYEKGDILIDGGIGLGIYGTNVKQTISGVTNEESDGTASVLIPIKVQYGISKKFSVGILVQPENYIVDNDSASIKKEDAKGSSFRVIGTYYIINNDKFNLNAEIGFGSATFKQEVEENGNTSEAEWRGGNFALGLGLKYYFSKHIGFFANTSYSNYSFDIDKWTFNNVTIDADGWEAKFSGAEVTVGLALKF